MARVNDFFGYPSDSPFVITTKRSGIYIATRGAPAVNYHGEARQLLRIDGNNTGFPSAPDFDIKCSLDGEHTDFGNFYFNLGFNVLKTCMLNVYGKIDDVRSNEMFNKWIQLDPGMIGMKITGGKYIQPDVISDKQFYCQFVGDLANGDVEITSWFVTFLAPLNTP